MIVSRYCLFVYSFKNPFYQANENPTSDAELAEPWKNEATHYSKLDPRNLKVCHVAALVVVPTA